MTNIIAIRHAKTDWSATKRLQGRVDRPLNQEGIEQALRWQLDPAWRSFKVYVSPLQRTQETAKLLGLHNFELVDALVEMNWGQYEGQSVAGLRELHGRAFMNNEIRGLDFRPPGGESPREVKTRLAEFLSFQGGQIQDQIWITHKGVRRALISWAFNWNMKGKIPAKTGDDEAAVFHFSPTTGRLRYCRSQNLMAHD